jgi:hypothetical protein
MSKPTRRLGNEVKRDFYPLIEFMKSAEIQRGKQNDFDEPVIGNFSKYVVTYGDIVFAGQGLENARKETRKILFEMIAVALGIKTSEISDLDFEVESRDPRMGVMNLVLADGTQVRVPLIDKSATKEE